MGYASDEAVKAALTLPWSNGPVEGPINCLKRSEYGRMNVNLLRPRVLYDTGSYATCNLWKNPMDGDSVQLVVELSRSSRARTSGRIGI